MQINPFADIQDGKPERSVSEKNLFLMYSLLSST
jgi:hypothetical protein